MSNINPHERISGSRVVGRTIRPPRVAFLVQNIEHCDFLVQVCSLNWGGKNFCIVPYDKLHGLTDEWWRLLTAYDPDTVVSLCNLDEVTERHLFDLAATRFLKLHRSKSMPTWDDHVLNGDAIFGTSLYRVLANLSTSEQDKDRFTPVSVPKINPSHPMALFIKARYGFLNEIWASAILGREGLKYDLLLKDFVPLQTLELPDEDAFLDYLINHEELLVNRGTPVPLLDYTLIGLNQVINFHDPQDSNGSHIFHSAQYLLMVSEEASVEDFCWYWNLKVQRPAHKKLPLWLPKKVLISKKSQVSRLLNRSKGSTLANCFLISKTVPKEELTSLAREYGEDIKVETDNLDKFYNPLFSLGAKDEQEVFFANGVGKIPIPQSELIRYCSPPSYYYIDVEVPRYQLPSSVGWSFSSYRVSKTGLSFPNPPSNRGYLTVEIPTAWELLELFATEAGYKVELSDKGKIGERIIHLIQGVDNVWVLSGRTIYQLFDELSELSQAKEFKGRLKGLVDSLNVENGDDTVNQILHTIASDRHDRVLKGYSDIKRILNFTVTGAQTTMQKFVDWLLDKGLIFRGVELSCPICGTKQWMHIDELGSRVRCIGCQETVNIPLKADVTQWVYRINTLYAKAHEQGVIPHLLTLNYAIQVLGVTRSKPLGLFPGVKFNFQENQPDKDIEIDVAWIDSGLLTIGECKTRGKDLSRQEVERYTAFGQRIGCRQIVFSTLDNFKDLAEETRQLISSSNMPILCLSQNDLFHQHRWSQNESKPSALDFEKQIALFLEEKQVY